ELRAAAGSGPRVRRAVPRRRGRRGRPARRVRRRPPERRPAERRRTGSRRTGRWRVRTGQSVLTGQLAGGTAPDRRVAVRADGDRAGRAAGLGRRAARAAVPRGHGGAAMRSYVPALIRIAVFAAVTVLLTGILAATIANTTFGPSAGYTARFADASGLHEGDDVRMSGVKIGQVQRISVGEDNRADVHFDIHGERRLPGLVTATVKYRNLIGQRYLSLSADVPESPPLEPGGTIPVERTQPALNLTVLFDGS